jgi:Uma2 family endonuclease
VTLASRRAVVTEAMYLAMERASDVKHELRDGDILAMAGASPRHNRLAARCLAELDSALRSRPCAPLGSDQRVHIPATGNYCYPDITVVCDPPEYHREDQDAITNPRVIVEVLSRSTHKDDLGTKFEDYRSIAAFEEYVLISQDRIHVEVRRREGPKRWTIEELSAGDELELRSLGIRMPVDALYEGAFGFRGDEP